MKRRILTHILATAIAGFPLAGGALAADPAQCATVRFADVGWADITATTATSSVVLKADHFLSKNWTVYSDEKLEDYAGEFYKLLQDNYVILTEKTKGMIPYMIENNWLVSYSTLAGLEMILFQMDYRTQHRANMQEAIVEVQEFYVVCEEEFTYFFEELRKSCEEKLRELL